MTDAWRNRYDHWKLAAPDDETAPDEEEAAREGSRGCTGRTATRRHDVRPRQPGGLVTMTADTTTVPVVTDDEAAAINAARDALHAIRERAMELAKDPPAGPDDLPEARSQDFGRLTGYAAVAFNLLFDVLNVAHAYCNAPLTDAQLHNREEA